MRPELHAQRLDSAMAEIRRRGHFTRSEPSFILIQTRRLLEEANLKKSFPVLTTASQDRARIVFDCRMANRKRDYFHHTVMNIVAP
jgi:hypothetical protein